MSDPVDRVDPGGPVVALCTGHRCTALRRLAGTPDGVAQIAEAVRHTHGAVLVTADCLGSCDRAALAGLAHRSAGSGGTGHAVWLSEVQTPERTASICAWVESGGPGLGGRGFGSAVVDEFPDCLRTVIAGFSSPMRMHPRD